MGFLIRGILGVMSKPNTASAREPVDSPTLLQAIALVQTMGGWELSKLRVEIGHEQAAQEGFSNDPRLEAKRRRHRITVGIDEADLQCRRELGRPLAGTDDYKRFKPKSAPSLNSIYQIYRSFDDALEAAAHLAIPYAKTRLVGGREYHTAPSVQECIEAAAQVYEYFEGADWSWIDWRLARKALKRTIPDIEAVVGRTRRTGRHVTRPTKDVKTKAIAWIMKNPARYPNAFAFFQRRNELGRSAA